jgi:hypothetical protein
VIDRHEGSVRSIVEIDLDFVFDCRAGRVGVSDVTDEGLTDVAPNKLGLGLWLWCLRRLGRGGFILGLSGGSRRRVGAARCTLHAARCTLHAAATSIKIATTTMTGMRL